MFLSIYEHIKNSKKTPPFRQLVTIRLDKHSDLYRNSVKRFTITNYCWQQPYPIQIGPKLVEKHYSAILF